MEGTQRQRFRDFVALAIPTLFLFGLLSAGIAQGATDASPISVATLAAFFALQTYRSRPRPMDRRVLKPIATGGLLLLATILAVRFVVVYGGESYLALGLGSVGIAFVVVIVRWQVLAVIGPKPKGSKTR